MNNPWRVYHIAQQCGVPSKRVREELDNLGYKTLSASSKVEPPIFVETVITTIRRKIASGPYSSVTIPNVPSKYYW